MNSSPIVRASKPRFRFLLIVLMLLVAVAVAVAVGGFWCVWSLQPKPLLAPKAALLPPPTIPPGSEWKSFAADDGATQYSPLSQINPDNVTSLKVAWTYRTGEATRHAADLGHSSFQNTPILAGGSLIVCTPWSRIIALDPATGKEKWTFDPQMTMKQPGWQKYMCRGVAAWTDPEAPADAPCAERLLFGTNDLRIFAIDAKTGQRCTGFTANGEIQATVPEGELFPGEVQFNAPPAVVNGVMIIGSMVADGARRQSPHGIVRAYDARTGAQKWIFDPIPNDPNDPAWATWKNDGALKFGSANVWADMSVDAKRNLVFLPTTSPSSDGNGSERHGDNRHANSTIALDASTGKIVWEYQIVHHDLWDYDLPTAPLLTDLTIEGQTRPAAIQLTKMGLVFVFDRDTGKPLFPVEEKPVAQSDVPGEQTSPTQPFPTTMPSLMETRFTSEPGWGFTFWDQNACRHELVQSRSLGLYGPKSKQGTILYPWSSGGSNTGSRAYDPQRKLLIASVIRSVGVIVQKEAGSSELAVTHKAGDGKPPVSGVLLSPFGAPCGTPPWGMLMALDIEKQKIVWQVPLGSIEKLLPLPIPLRFGTPMRGGPIVTGGGLVFVAGTMDDAIRAFDTATGEERWKAHLPAGGQATPMTYMANGKQYVVIAAGGHAWMKTRLGDYVVAYALDK